MSDVQVRPFRRGDRDQLTSLVNAHAEAVVPGLSVSVNTVLGSLERQPGEFIVDPWVSERVTWWPNSAAGSPPPRTCSGTTPTTAPGPRTETPARSAGCSTGRWPRPAIPLAGRDRGGGGADSRVH